MDGTAKTFTPAGARPGPVEQSERIASIDVLRGFALLGILVVNIQGFAMISQAYFNPTAYGDLTGANYLVWLMTHVLFDQKFMTLFSALFGAGIVLMASRAESLGNRPIGVHYRRVLWLILFGLLHAHLLWYGDILYLYGMCGLIVYPFRKLRPRWLLPLGFLSVSVASALFILFGWSMQFWPPEQTQAFVAEDWQPGPEVAQLELDSYRGGWLTQMEHRVPAAAEFETFIFFIWGFWRAGGLMLIGMALFKLGIFSAKRSTVFYAALVAIGLLIGVPIVYYGVYRHFEAGWAADYSFFFGGQFNYWASLLVSLGWLGLVMLVCKLEVLRPLTRGLAAVGRMALSNYLLHTIICTFIFYGHGLGLFGRVERVGQLAIVLSIWVVQLVVSPIWLRHFRFGPFEWAWRSLTYLKLQPFRI